MSKSDKEDVEMDERDDELVFLPKCLLDKFVEARDYYGHFENLYDRPMSPEPSKSTCPNQDVLEGVRKEKGCNKKKWGPVLVEPRPCRQPRDGRTVLEKSQDRNKHTNLEGGHGNSKTYNTFCILSNSEIVYVARIVNVEIGNNRFEKSSSLAKIKEVDLGRAEVFNRNYSVCQSSEVADMTNLDGRSSLVEGGDDAPNTPMSQVVITVHISDINGEGAMDPCSQ
jgi:hypothetical protein